MLRDICRVEIDTSGRSLKAQAKSADQRRARLLLVAGEDEMTAGVFQFKNLATGEQRAVERGEIVAAVREVLSK